jgi:hypothetical protein
VLSGAASVTLLLATLETLPFLAFTVLLALATLEVVFSGACVSATVSVLSKYLFYSCFSSGLSCFFSSSISRSIFDYTTLCLGGIRSSRSLSGQSFIFEEFFLKRVCNFINLNYVIYTEEKLMI